MRQLSIKQPWAELIASGRKTIELRSWSTSYRGPILVVASLQRAREWPEFDGPRGAAICLVDLVEVRPATAADANDGVHRWRGVRAWIQGVAPRGQPMEASNG